MSLLYRVRSQFVLAMAVVCTAWSVSSCGFGTAGLVLGTQGGSEAAPPPPLSSYDFEYDERIGGSEPVPGQVIAADVANPLQLELATAQDYVAVWRRGAPALSTTTVRPMTKGRVSLVVPLGLARGAYLVDVSIGVQLARIVVSVGAPLPDVPDAVAYLGKVREEWAELRQGLAARTSAADLVALDAGMAAFDGAIDSLTSSEAMILARVLKANDALRADAPSAPYVGMDLIRDASAAASLLAERALAALGATSSLQVPEGASPVLEPLLEASLRLRAMFGVLLAYDRWRATLERPWKPEAASDLQVTSAAGGPLDVAYGVAAPVACTADCRSLVADDRSGGDARIAAVFADLDRVTALQLSLGNAVSEVLQSRVPALPAPAIRARVAVDPTRLTLVGQSNPDLLVAVVGGQVSARFGPGQSGSTDVTFVYADVPWSTAQVTRVQVQNDPQMVPIAAGTFAMGSATALAFANEAPVHTVTISRPFWMAKYETRQSEYQAVVGSNPSAFVGPDLPVESVTWDEARAYCTALTAQQASVGLVPTGYHYRLPTEAEWEYCCRAGTTTEWNLGNGLSCAQANCTDDASGNPCNGPQTIQVGSYAANAWGLHDMHGNVWEWCLDSSNLIANYPVGPVTDPFVNGGTRRTNRGGGWVSGSRYSRSPHRSATEQTFRRTFTGFRVVLAPVLEP